MTAQHAPDALDIEHSWAAQRDPRCGRSNQAWRDGGRRRRRGPRERRRPDRGRRSRHPRRHQLHDHPRARTRLPSHRRRSRRGAGAALHGSTERDHRGTAFTVSVDGAPEHGVTTGISAPDRAATIQLMLAADAGALPARPHLPAHRPAGRGAGTTRAHRSRRRFRHPGRLPPAGVIVEIIGDDEGDAATGAGGAFRAPARMPGPTSIQKLREYLVDLPVDAR